MINFILKKFYYDFKMRIYLNLNVQGKKFFIEDFHEFYLFLTSINVNYHLKICQQALKFKLN